MRRRTKASLLKIEPRPQMYERELPSGKTQVPAELSHKGEPWPTTCRAEELPTQSHRTVRNYKQFLFKVLDWFVMHR